MCVVLGNRYQYAPFSESALPNINKALSLLAVSVQTGGEVQRRSDLYEYESSGGS